MPGSQENFRLECKSTYASYQIDSIPLCLSYCEDAVIHVIIILLCYVIIIKFLDLRLVTPMPVKSTPMCYRGLKRKTLLSSPFSCTRNNTLGMCVCVCVCVCMCVCVCVCV